jgi:hypothetical protein
VLFTDNMQRYVYVQDVQVCSSSRLTPPFASRSPSSHSLLYLPIPLFTYLENQLLLLVVRIPIHSCPWFVINCSPLAASPPQGTSLLHIYIDNINNISRLVWYIYNCKRAYGLGSQCRPNECLFWVWETPGGRDFWVGEGPDGQDGEMQGSVYEQPKG